jgi:crotonobetainyl-CoA:carnitine CoA-transferase CaiB-like acyl-CoA transferase
MVVAAGWFGFSPPQNWGDLGTLLGAVASIVAASIAVVAATYAKRQIQEGRRVQAESLAQQTYSSYLLKAFEHPDLAMGDPTAIQQAGASKYKWLMSYMLNACEGIVTSLPGDKIWESCAMTQLRYHKDYLTNDPWFTKNYERLYEPAFVKLIQAVQAERNSS